MKDNGRPLVIFDADKVSSNADDSGRISRIVPAWILSCCINAAIIAAFFLLTAPAAETADLFSEGTMMTIPETTVQPPDLEVEDLGIGGRDINFDHEKLATVSIPGEPTPDPIGMQGDEKNLLRSVPPPPGVSRNAGGGPLGTEPGRAIPLFGPDGGHVAGKLFEPGNLGTRGSGATRQRALIEGGGNPASEAAVARGVKWLINHQAQDGRWSLQSYREHGRCNCTGGGTANSDVAGTAFGLLPLLGSGQTHKPGSTSGQLYTKQVEKALAWLVLRQNREGGWETGSHHEMYSHGLATIALCEAYALTSDTALHDPAQRALNYICMAQTREGGWRYQAKGQTGYDSSIGAWELMALKSGQMAGLDVPRENLSRASKWLDAAASPDGGRYGYTTPHPANGLRPATTSAGLLCRMYLGWSDRSPGLLSGVQYLRAHKPRVNDMYYSYYATQVMHHMGGQYWAEWNPVMRDELIAAQDKGDKVPHQAGSWYDPTDQISSGHGGRIMQTSLSLVTLEVYYRHLPLYRRDVGVNKDIDNK